eukprot:scaffold7923_cov154-Skeletonema_menzelii.AAC.3
MSGVLVGVLIARSKPQEAASSKQRHNDLHRPLHTATAANNNCDAIIGDSIFSSSSCNADNKKKKQT